MEPIPESKPTHKITASKRNNKRQHHGPPKFLSSLYDILEVT